MSRAGRERRRAGRAGAVVLSLAAFAAGCYTSREIQVDSLRGFDEEVTCCITSADGSELRARISPGRQISDAFIECVPCAWDAASWRIRYSGWPAVYRSGRYWRPETTGEVVLVPREDIVALRIEGLNWPLTIISAPLTLPAGFIDFLVDNVQIGFDAVNDRFDSFAPPPPSARTGSLPEQPVEEPLPPPDVDVIPPEDASPDI